MASKRRAQKTGAAMRRLVGVYSGVPSSTRRVSGAQVDRGNGTGKCPACGVVLAIRKDGEVYNHRRGTSMKESYLCLGGRPVE